MRHQPFLLGWVIFTALLTVCPLPAHAQDPLTQTLTTTSGALTLDYPSDWQAQEFQEQIYLTNSPTGIAGLDTTNLPPATIMVVVAAMPYTAIEGLVPNATFEDVLAYIEDSIATESADAPVNLTVSEDLTINNYRAHRYIGEQAGQELYLLAMDVGRGNIMGLQALTLAGEMTPFIPTLESIATSIVYTPPAPTVIAGRVIWQQTAGLDFEGGNLTELSDLTVGPDDTLYIADESNGIAIFDADGNFQRLIFGVNAANAGPAQDAALAPDGTLYAVGGNQLIYHLDTNGNVLNTWGEAGGDDNQFGEASPFEIEIAPDGTLITLDSQDGADGSTLIRVQTWDTSGQLLTQFTPLDENNAPVVFGFATLAIGPEGSIYLAEFGEIYRYAHDGTLLDSHIGAATLTTTSISDLEIAPDGSLLVATYDGIIYQLDASGHYLHQFGTPQIDPDPEDPTPIAFIAGEFSAPEGIALLSNGDIVVSDTNFDYWQVVRFTFDTQ